MQDGQALPASDGRRRLLLRAEGRRKDHKRAREAALDGLYVLRTTCESEELGARAVVRACKQLKVAARVFHQRKSSEILIRPIHHHLEMEMRVRAHVFL